MTSDCFQHVYICEYIRSLSQLCLLLLLTILYEEMAHHTQPWVALSHEELVTCLLGNLVTAGPGTHPCDGDDSLPTSDFCLAMPIPSKTTWTSFFLVSREFLIALKKIFYFVSTIGNVMWCNMENPRYIKYCSRLILR